MTFPPAEWKSSSTGEAIWVVSHLRPKKRGSMEQQFVALARRLRDRGVSLTYVFSGLPAAWLQEELDRLGVTTYTLEFQHELSCAWALARLLRSARPALVHFHFVRAYSPLVAAARLCGTRVVLNDHVTLTRASESGAREAFKQARSAALNPLVDCRVAVARVVADSVADVERVERARIRVIENGIDLARFESARPEGVLAELGAQGEPLLVCVSRLSSEKGVETAIRALPMVRQQAVLALVGEGPMETAWRALAQELRVADRVRFLGLRDDVERLLAVADVVLAPSHWEEAFGLAVVEAMAAGRPVVVSRSGAMPEIVGDAGLVVPKRDVGALAGAITRLLDDRALAERIGRAARERVRERYGMDRYVDRVVALYEQFLPSMRMAIAA